MHHWKDLFEGYKILPLHVSNMPFSGRYESPKFQDNKSPNFGIPNKKCHMDLAPMESHRIYYKEGSGASSQKLQVV
jgi:hypothetical protein